MAGFEEILGHDSIKRHLQRAVETGMVSHAYILNGEDGMGKKSLACAFALALLCENRKAEGCMECHACRQVLSGNHPDLIFVTHEKPNSIGVDDVREQINDTIRIMPYSSSYKIYIIDESEKMTVQAQNALLKTLEEPPEYAVILILTTNMETLLPTILSRCVVLNMKPVRNDQIKKFLMENMEIPDYKADICVAFARGNLGKARLLAKSEEFDKVKEEAITLLKYIGEMELNEVAAAIKKINEFKFDVNDYLDILSIWYRDVLLFKATHDANNLIFREEIQYIRKVADKSTYEGIERIIDALEKSKQRLNANVNFDLTIELLLLTIKEN